MPNTSPRPQLNIKTDVQPIYYGTRRSASIASGSSSLSSTPSSDASAFTSPETTQWQHSSLPIVIATPTYCADGQCCMTGARSLSPIRGSPDSESTSQCTGETTRTRNTLIRALTYSYDHCLLLRPCTQEATDFLMFNQQIALCLYQYRHIESDSSRPGDDALLNELGAVTTTVESRKKLIDGVRIFEEYAAQTTADEYNGVIFQDIIQALGPFIPGLNPLSSSAAPEKASANHASG